MVFKCCVPERKSSKDIPVHVFPKNVHRREEWLRAIQRHDLISKILTQNIYIYIYTDCPATREFNLHYVYLRLFEDKSPNIKFEAVILFEF